MCDAFPLGWSPKRDPTNTKIYQKSHIQQYPFSSSPNKVPQPSFVILHLYWVRNSLSGCFRSLAAWLLLFCYFCFLLFCYWSFCQFVFCHFVILSFCYYLLFVLFTSLSNERQQSEWVLRKPCSWTCHNSWLVTNLSLSLSLSLPQ